MLNSARPHRSTGGLDRPEAGINRFSGIDLSLRSLVNGTNGSMALLGHDVIFLFSFFKIYLFNYK